MPPGEHNFEYLKLLQSSSGPAILQGGGKVSPQTKVNQNARQAHSDSLRTAAQALITNWQGTQNTRVQLGLPEIPAGLPILLQVDPSLDLDVLREYFAFEIVAEQEEGFVIVASEDIDVALFLAMVQEFATAIHGSATIAKIHQLFNNPQDRLRRVLSDTLFLQWHAIADTQICTVDISISCTGTTDIPKKPNRRKRESDADWAARHHIWEQQRNAAYDAWDELKIERENAVRNIVGGHNGTILDIVHDGETDAGLLPDCFSVRVRISGRGLKDFVLNYPFVFEALEPEDIDLGAGDGVPAAMAGTQAQPVAPDPDAPSVCVIDSGIQEGHVLLQPAIDPATSHCFVPAKAEADVADQVQPGGHGTRVAGAILYGETVPTEGTPQLPFWIENARVLDENNRMPEALFPPEAMRYAVQRFHEGPRHTRIFNHSINAYGYCRLRYMSAWAAEIDALSATYDILVIQSAGNILTTGPAPYPGIRDHLVAGRGYPEYLLEDASRVANPAQSLQALTVGSIAYGPFTDGNWRTFAPAQGHPSAFSRTGPSIWRLIKPEVVEYGGDHVHTDNVPVDVQPGGLIGDGCPELVRSTMYPPGPAADRDDTGTSYATPKVTRIAAQLQQILPGEPALLYRGLIVQSAHWPEWAEGVLNQLRSNPPHDADERVELHETAFAAMRSLGYGLPNEARATANTEFRATFITSGKTGLRARGCHFYQVPIPAAMRLPGDDFDIRIDVTLSYVAQPRRTRRNLRRYLSTWLDWRTSNLGEGLQDFKSRVIKNVETEGPELPGTTLPWTLHELPNAGLIRGYKRNGGTVQKDWALVKSNRLPADFCIAVRGHQGWSRDPDDDAEYTLAVTLEIVDQEIAIYDPLRTAVLELETEIEANAGEAEIEINE